MTINILIEKLSLADCRKILSKNGKNYSDGEVIAIRDLLYCLAQIDIQTFRHNENLRDVGSVEKINIVRENKAA